MHACVSPASFVQLACARFGRVVVDVYNLHPCFPAALGTPSVQVVCHAHSPLSVANRSLSAGGLAHRRLLQPPPRVDAHGEAHVIQNKLLCGGFLLHWAWFKRAGSKPGTSPRVHLMHMVRPVSLPNVCMRMLVGLWRSTELAAKGPSLPEAMHSVSPEQPFGVVTPSCSRGHPPASQLLPPA